MTSPQINLGNPYVLGATGVTISARFDRIALAASFRPSSAAIGIVSGFLAGPPNTQGETTLVSDALLRVFPFTALIQGTHNSQQGQYVVPNGTQRDLTVPAKDASLFRRALVVVRVADSIEAGVASSATTDGAFLEVLSGTLVASNPALPATPANALVVGELSVPSVASGQPVTWTPYNPRTASRGGILPVIDDAIDRTGHGGALPLFAGEYRDHPSRGLERGTAAGGAWEPVSVRNAPVVRAGATPGSLVIPNNVFTTTTWNIEQYDPLDMLEAANRAALRCRVAGYYRVAFGFSYQGGLGARAALQVRKALAASPNTFAGTGIGVLQANGGSPQQGLSCGGIVPLAVGDLLRFDAYQDTGASQPNDNADYSPTFIEAEWIRPL